jgi:crossover junction endodeoxyribonuclease RuvC
MTILGVDPSTVATGWGILDGDARRARATDSGVIRPHPDLRWEEKLRAVHEEMLQVVDRTGPELLVIESTFLHRNVRTALLLGQVRGVILLAAAMRGLAIAEYSASEIKRAIVGNGSAEKTQVMHMMTRLLGLPAPPSHDEADALAAAWCHLSRSAIPQILRAAR